MQIASNGRITPRMTCQNVVVRVYVKGYTGDTNPYAETSITITDSTANGLSLIHI